MALGKCRHCGYSRVAYDALVCPACGGMRPNPSALSSAFSQVAIVGMIGFFTIFGCVLFSVARQSNQESEKMRQQTRKAEQQSCEVFKGSPNPPPWCN